MTNLAIGVAFIAGCAQQPTLVNPSFNVSIATAKQQLDAMREEDAHARPQLDRPLVVLDGIGSWGIGAVWIRSMITPRVGGGPIVLVSYPLAFSFDDCRREVIAEVDRKLGVVSDRETVEVDVLGASLGGVVGAYAALDDPTLGKRLKIRRLYTISSPMTGAELARKAGALSFVPLHRDLRPSSNFYKKLAHATPDYDVISYTRLDDDIVGPQYAAAPGHGVYWLANEPFEHAHFAVMDDPRIIADILHRLRGERSLSNGPPEPLPSDAH